MKMLSQSNANPMGQILLVVGAAIVIFLSVTGYSVHKSVQSSGHLADVKDLYFPVLQRIEANTVRVDKMDELFMRAVMLGDRDPIDEAQDVFKQTDKVFDEIAALYPAKQGEVARLRATLKRYDNHAVDAANAVIKHSDQAIALAKQMNVVLEELRVSTKSFHDSSYADFVETLAQSQRTVKVNLYLGIALGVMNLCFMGVLVFFIRRNISMMVVIAEQNASLERRVSERTAQLRQKTNDIQAMLQNMPQGVLTVLAGSQIHPEYSAYLETIFETKEIAGKSVMDLVFSHTSLGSDVLSQVDATVGSCIGEDEMNFEFNSHLLATEFDKTMPDGRVRSLELSWSPIVDDECLVDKLMLCVRDVTEFKRLASAAGAQKRELEIIGEILAVSQEKFQGFIGGAQQFLDENAAVIRKTAARDIDAIGLLFRNMHTIKGNARTFGLGHITNVVHETEQAYDTLRSDADAPWQPEALLAQLAQVQALVDEYRKINDITLGRKGPGRRGNVERFLMVEKNQVASAMALIEANAKADLADARVALDKLGRMLSLIGTERVESALAGILESMPSLAVELGKEPPQITVASNGIVVRNHIVGTLKNVFTHLFRNSIDHGLETAEVRQRAGKTAAGHILLTLSLSSDGEQLRMVLRDDGAGLAVGKIRKKAIASGLLSEGDTSSAEDVAQLIFASGFSTADQLTEVSGRGVGMDAVRGFLKNEGGDVAVRFTEDNAANDMRLFELVIELPAKFAVQTRATEPEFAPT